MFSSKYCITLEFVMQNEKGLHVRPCAEILRILNFYNLELHVTCNDVTHKISSLLEFLSLNISKGERVIFRVFGLKGIEGLKKISDFLNSLN
jgi:phosphotransferase system HPr (HPr) family protein